MVPALFGLLLAVPVVLYLDLQAERGLLVILFASALALLAMLTGRLTTAYAEEHELLETVSANEARHRSLVEVLPAVVYRAEFGHGAAERELSPRVEAMLGFEHEDWVARGIKWFDRIHPEDRPEVLARERTSRATGHPLSCDYRMVASDGREIWVRDEALVVNERGRPVLHGVIHDVTDHMRAQIVLKERSAELARTVREQTSGLNEAELGTVYRLAVTAEMRDGETHTHTLRVGRSASLLAAEVGLEPDQVELIRLAAPLHDIGKLGVSDAILHKPGPLTPEETALMQMHVEMGRQILEGSSSEVLRAGAEIAFTHHEWWDGGGYPRGLEEETIPLPGRVTAVADAFDAMTHSRPYKEAWPIDHALNELRVCAGTQFDPWLVEAFEELDHESLLLPNEDEHDASPAPGWPTPMPAPPVG